MKWTTKINIVVLLATATSEKLNDILRKFYGEVQMEANGMLP